MPSGHARTFDPLNASCLPAPASRPPAQRLLEPVPLAPEPPEDPPRGVDPPTFNGTDEPLDPVLRQVATAITTGIVEALAGRRPLAQLERWASGDLISLVGHLSRARVARDLRLRSIRVQSPEFDVAEVAAHLRQGPASRAAAFRLQRRDGHWTCTHLEIALRPDAVSRAG